MDLREMMQWVEPVLRCDVNLDSTPLKVGLMHDIALQSPCRLSPSLV